MGVEIQYTTSTVLGGRLLFVTPSKFFVGHFLSHHHHLWPGFFCCCRFIRQNLHPSLRSEWRSRRGLAPGPHCHLKLEVEPLHTLEPTTVYAESLKPHNHSYLCTQWYSESWTSQWQKTDPS